jgi:GntR family transcriptional regulator / MocR family aminotransferase
MQKNPTNSLGALRKVALPLDLLGPHVTPGASAQDRLYRALCHAIVGGIVKPGEALPPSRTLAKQIGFRRNAVTDAYERLIADGFAVARVGSGTFVAARVPARVRGEPKTSFIIEEPQHGTLALGCTHIDGQALRRFRAFAGRRMRAFGAEHLHYGDPRGSRELRAAIADRLLSARGLRCDPDQIMLTSGTQHGLRIVLSAILKAQDQIWCEDPGYPAARKSIEHYGGRPVAVPVDDYGLVVAKGRAAAPSARAAYVTPSHQFPLGVQMSMPRRLELLDWAKSADAWIFEDDYDSEFRYDGAPLLSLAGIDHLRRVIYMGTFAKTLFPGLRIGYCALPAALIGPATTARTRPVSGHAAGRRRCGYAELRRVCRQSAQGPRALSRGARRVGREAVNGVRGPAVGTGAVAGPASGCPVRSFNRLRRGVAGQGGRRRRGKATGGDLYSCPSDPGIRPRICRPPDSTAYRIG